MHSYVVFSNIIIEDSNYFVFVLSSLVEPCSFLLKYYFNTASLYYTDYT